jgi:hypothetical protein
MLSQIMYYQFQFNSHFSCTYMYIHVHSQFQNWITHERIFNTLCAFRISHFFPLLKFGSEFARFSVQIDSSPICCIKMRQPVVGSWKCVFKFRLPGFLNFAGKLHYACNIDSLSWRERLKDANEMFLYIFLLWRRCFDRF